MKPINSKTYLFLTVTIIASVILTACAPMASLVTSRTHAHITKGPIQSSYTKAVVKTQKIDPLVFQQDVRKLWEDHITWTRVFIMSFLADLPDANTAAGRLLQNQADIGNSIKPFYGDAAGNQLTALLRDHILIAADILADAKAGDTAKLAIDKARWYDNANQIAAFLHAANPDNWPLADMQNMMKMHLDLTLQEASARLNGDWNADVAAYDQVHDEILQMADMLSAGIMQQFPKSFYTQRASPAEVQLTLAMNKLWEDHVTWTRVFIISFLADLPDANTAAGRLLQNQVDIGNAIKPYYGTQAGDQLTALLRDHILIAADLLADAKAGDTAKFATDKARWYDNADQIARFLSSANPKNWPLEDMQDMMKKHLDLTLQEATARLNADWQGDVVAYDKVHKEILEMAGMLTQGIVAQFPVQFK